MTTLLCFLAGYLIGSAIGAYIAIKYLDRFL